MEIQVGLRRKLAGNCDVAVFIRYSPFQEAQIVNGCRVGAFGSCHRTGKDAERGEQRPRKPHHYNMRLQYVFLSFNGGHTQSAEAVDYTQTPPSSFQAAKLKTEPFLLTAAPCSFYIPRILNHTCLG